LNHATQGVGRTYPQHQEMGPKYDYDAPDSVHQLPYDGFPDFEPNFRTVVIEPSAKLTDLISSAPIRSTGLLVSERFNGVLESFTLPPHRFYPVPMTHKKKPVKGYWWLQLPQPKVDLEESTPLAEAEACIEADPVYGAADLLQFYRPNRFSYCFVSAPLRAAIEAARLTGIRFGTAKLFR
jgi:hypothetical protein